MNKLVTRTRRKIVGSDYSAQEPRITAHLSGEQKMLDAYLEGKDLYAVIASSALNNEYGENLEFWPEGTELEIDGQKVIAGKKTHKNLQGKANRSIGKKLLLASTYGMGAGRAGETMGKTKEEGQALLDNFFAGFPKVKEAIDYSKQCLLENGWVEDWYGRQRHIPERALPDYEISYKDKKKARAETFNPLMDCEDRDVLSPQMKEFLARAEKCRGNERFKDLAKEADKAGFILVSNTGKKAQAERQCFNARIQGGAATLTKLAMLNIYFDEDLKKYGAKLVCSVHDEILVECLDYYNKEVEERLPQIMVDTAKPYMKVPMSCDPYNVQRWYADECANHLLDDAKKLEAKGMTAKEIALELIEENSEFPAISILKVLKGEASAVEWQPEDYDVDVSNLL